MVAILSGGGGGGIKLKQHWIRLWLHIWLRDLITCPLPNANDGQGTDG